MTLFVLTNIDHGWLFPLAWLAEQFHHDSEIKSFVSQGQLFTIFHWLLDNFWWRLRSWLFYSHQRRCVVKFLIYYLATQRKYDLKISDLSTMELQTAASKLNSVISANISEHCDPKLQGRVAQGSDCFSSWLWLFSKETDHQSLL